MEKQKTIAKQLEDVITEMCNNYCKYPQSEEYKDRQEDMWDEICDNCPLNKIM